MKKFLAVLLGVFFVASFAFAQDVDLEQLKKQIADLQAQVDQMSKFVNQNTRHTATDKLSISAEFMTRLDSIQYKDVRAMPDMMEAMMGDFLQEKLTDSNGYFMTTYRTVFTPDLLLEMAQNDAEMYKAFSNVVAYYNSEYGAGIDPSDGLDTTEFQTFMGLFANDRTLNADEAKLMERMLANSKPKKYDANNDYMLTERLRLRLKSKINEHVSFTGRLVMYKTFGDSTPIHFFNGTMSSMFMDSNSAQYPTDDSVRVERAYFVYKNSIGDVHWHFSFGRRPAAYGYGMENHENAVLGGSPVASIIQMNFDGGSLGFNLEDVTGIPGFNIKFCYGEGVEGQYGTLNSLNSQADVNDVHFFGVIAKLFDNDEYKVVYNYAHGFGLTDGFIGLTVMPFYIHGYDKDRDGIYDEYTFEPNFGGFVSRVEPTSEVGNIDLHTLMVEGITYDFSWFASYSMSKTDPTGRSKNPMYQFMGMDEMMDGTGHMIWVGVMTPELPYTGGKLGFEYNHGSKYWQPFMNTWDAQKLATRGDVYEVYYHQPIVGNKFFLTTGFIYYDYEYTNSGNYLGEPVKISEATAFNTMMPVVDKVEQFYLKATYRF
ncbi:DUF3373 domain-containing protein [Deferribacter autotrophicus]|uniref:DUF3373 domain-containing protein n=1 Tax=Deferribacter autotrophicus TaxID=500465 RepID=A0A5A8F0Q3_9BACT|nr:DUF3373 family protein [Deferribacter autotrophicus]KAA0256981.1 DUF3373 domain-containing protein [Deferribacter autotrophicus]